MTNIYKLWLVQTVLPGVKMEELPKDVKIKGLAAPIAATN
jgi:hypothetical protein